MVYSTFQTCDSHQPCIRFRCCTPWYAMTCHALVLIIASFSLESMSCIARTFRAPTLPSVQNTRGGLRVAVFNFNSIASVCLKSAVDTAIAKTMWTGNSQDLWAHGICATFCLQP